jgi:ABC-type phosphate transport system substrate-binding protein
MLKSSLPTHLNPGRVVFFLFPLFLSGAPILAGESHHSRAPEFSDPKVLAPVPGEWSSQPVKHLAKYGDADLVIALGQQSHPLFRELILEYAKANRLNIVVEQGTCGITSGRLLKKKVDIGAFCCPPGKNDRLPGLKFYSLGIAPIALIVHPDNPLQNVSSQQARDIFAGEISRWSEIASGDDQLINPVGRLHCKTRPGHWRSLLKSGDEFSPRLVEVGVIPDMISQVSRNVSTIGWETPLMVDFHQKKGNVKILTIDGHSPTDIDYVLTGQYPLYRSYSLTAWSEKNSTNKQAVKLIRYLQQHVEKIHQQIGFIPASRLKQAGWRFIDDELVGEPAVLQQILR